MGTTIESENLNNENIKLKSDEEDYLSLVKTYQRLLDNYWNSKENSQETENAN